MVDRADGGFRAVAVSAGFYIAGILQRGLFSAAAVVLPVFDRDRLGGMVPGAPGKPAAHRFPAQGADLAGAAQSHDLRPASRHAPPGEPLQALPQKVPQHHGRPQQHQHPEPDGLSGRRRPGLHHQPRPQDESVGSMSAAREKGMIRSEGKEYVVKDGDIILFRFNV